MTSTGEVGLSADEKRAITGRARTLHERFDGPKNVPGDGPLSPGEILDAWRDLYPDEDAFRQRLARGEFDQETARAQLDATRWPDDEPLPRWIEELDELVSYVAVRDPDDDLPVTVDEETPFGDLLAAIASYGRERFPEDVVPSCGIADLEEWLLTRIKFACARTLFVEFKSFLEHRDPELAAMDPGEAVAEAERETADPSAVENLPTAHYEAFVDAMYGFGFRNLCLEYPVLARFVVGQIDRWLEMVEEVTERLRADRDALADRFDVAGEVTRLEPLTGDTHARGRTPVRVEFEEGVVVYKPRPVGMGAALSSVLDRLDDHFDVPPFETPAFLEREDYGWMERVEPRDLAGPAAARRYYERAGALLCVGYVLGLTDCHYSNLIASGEQPVVVDAEATAVPWIDPSVVPAAAEVRSTVSDSVLATGLVPWEVGDPDEEQAEGAVARAGLGSRSESMTVSTRGGPVIKAANTDLMHVEEEAGMVDPSGNTPSTDEGDHPPTEYADAIVRGFDECYRTVVDLHEDDRFTEEVLPDSLGDRQQRIMYRPTTKYASVLRAGVTGDALRDGARLTVAFERLAVPFFDGRIESDRGWPVYAAERRALRRLDVPRFSGRPDRTTIRHDGSDVCDLAEAAGIEKIHERLDALCPADRRRQVWVIERTYDSTEPTAPPDVSVDPTDDRLRREALDRCEALLDAAVGDGTRWASTTPSRRAALMGVIPADDELYVGRAGIGLALAAAAVETSQDRYREAAVGALDAVAAAEPTGEPGGLTGDGARVYALTVAADLLDHPGYRARAAELAARVPTAPEEDTLDVMDGTAGTLLALLAHHERADDSAALDRAVACGEHLLDARSGREPSRWRTIREYPTPGFAHGQAGIAHALARLAAATGDDRFADVAREALSLEETPPEADDDSRHLLRGDRWCRGRTGRAIAHLAVGTNLGDEELVAEADSLFEETAVAEPARMDHLCCGNLGRAMGLLEASRWTGRDPTDARALVGRCLAREGSLSMPGHGPGVTNPALFSGAAGAAYAFLRLYSPEAFPCVLLLE